MNSRLAGAVLAGGESRRMGTDKAQLMVEGDALWRRQLKVLTAAGAEIVTAVRRPGQALLGIDAPTIHDELKDLGPLAGLHAALRWASAANASWLAVVAVDLPAINVAWFGELRRRGGPGVGVVAHLAAGYEPLAAIYPKEALAVVEAQVAKGELALQRLVARLVAEGRMAVWELSDTGDARLRNWNTPADRGC